MQFITSSSATAEKIQWQGLQLFLDIDKVDYFD